MCLFLAQRMLSFHLGHKFLACVSNFLLVKLSQNILSSSCQNHSIHCIPSLPRLRHRCTQTQAHTHTHTHMHTLYNGTATTSATHAILCAVVLNTAIKCATHATLCAVPLCAHSRYTVCASHAILCVRRALYCVCAEPTHAILCAVVSKPATSRSATSLLSCSMFSGLPVFVQSGCVHAPDA